MALSDKGPRAWWAATPEERYWLEVTDRQDLGADLRAPKFNEQGAAYWSYSIVHSVRRGDVVLHYHKPARGIIARSVATGDVWEDEIFWGSHDRARGIQHAFYHRPGLYAGLQDFERFTTPVTLEDLDAKAETLRRGKAQLEAEHGAPLYYPFEPGLKRPVRPTQGYLFKLPKFVVEAFDVLQAPLEQAKPPEPLEHVLGASYRPANEETSVGRRDPFEVDPAVVERGTRAHALTQNALAAWVRARGWEPRSPAPGEPNYDLAWEEGDVLWVAEVKSLTDANETKQLRLGFGQVLHYRHQLQRATGREVRAMLWVEHEPMDGEWSVLCGGLGVTLRWP